MEIFPAYSYVFFKRPLKENLCTKENAFQRSRKYLRPLKNADFCLSSRKAIILTTDIHRVFRGLKFEPDAEIGQKGAFCKGLYLNL